MAIYGQNDRSGDAGLLLCHHGPVVLTTTVHVTLAWFPPIVVVMDRQVDLFVLIDGEGRSECRED